MNEAIFPKAEQLMQRMTALRADIRRMNELGKGVRRLEIYRDLVHPEDWDAIVAATRRALDRALEDAEREFDAL